VRILDGSALTSVLAGVVPGIGAEHGCHHGILRSVTGTDARSTHSGTGLALVRAAASSHVNKEIAHAWSRKLAVGTAMIGAVALTAAPARAVPAGVTVTLDQGVLSVVGDATANAIVVGRTPAGVLTLAGTPVLGGDVTVDNVILVHLDGGDGNDILTLNESNGVMPKGDLLGGNGVDKLTSRSGVDVIIP
jgi:Ca2+-binding RTX toxin-like protein